MDLERLERLGHHADRNPDDPDAWLGLAEALVDGAPELARPLLARAGECELARADQWKQVADVALRLRERRLARQALRATLRLEPDDVAALAWLARVAIEDGAADEAIPLLKKSLQGRDHPELRQWLVRAVAECQEADAAAAEGSPRVVVPLRETTERDQALPPELDGRSSPDLSAFSLPDMLEFLAQQHATGTLQVLSSEAGAQVHLRRGRLVDVEHPQRASIIDTLAARGFSDVPRLRTLPADTLADEASLVEALVHDGLVEFGVMQDALRSRIEEGIFHVLQWEQSYAQFRPGPVIDELGHGFDTHWVLLSVLRRIDDLKRA